MGHFFAQIGTTQKVGPLKALRDLVPAANHHDLQPRSLLLLREQRKQQHQPHHQEERPDQGLPHRRRLRRPLRHHQPHRVQPGVVTDPGPGGGGGGGTFQPDAAAKQVRKCERLERNTSHVEKMQVL